jgi:hypothetical protein
MRDKEPVDIITDIMALTTWRNRKNVILVAIEIRGPFDKGAFKWALNEAGSVLPNYRSVLREIHHGWTFYLTREYTSAIDIPVFESTLTSLQSAGSSFDAIISHLSPRLDRQWNLWEAPPLEVHVLDIGEERRVLAFLAHHSGGDLAMALKVITETIEQYHMKITGETLPSAKTPYVLSTAKKKASSAQKSGWRAFWSQLKRDLSYRKRRPQKPLGKGARNDTREWHVERVISAEDTARIFETFRKDGLHMVDHLVACTNLSLDEWNRGRQAEPGFISSVVTVNMRERFGGAEEKNYSSAIFFNSPPEQRKDYLQFVRAVAGARQKQLGRQLDLSLRKSIARGAKFFSLFPLWVRRRAARAFMELQHYSVAVGYLGVVWPAFTEEKTGLDSWLERLGHAKAVTAYGTGYKLAGNAYINLYAFVYPRQLHMVLSCPASLLTKEECEGFADLLQESVLRAAGLH